MDRLTFEEWCKELAAVVGPALFVLDGEFRLKMSIDLEAFYKRQSLSQEAVREEALEEAASVDQREVELRGWREAIRVLKRDPNAAGQTPLSVKTGSDAEADSRQVESATSACAKPAPAAPDYDDGDPAKWPPSGPTAPDVGECHVCSGPALKFGTGCALTNCPYRTAPDVASMVKRLRDCCAMIGYATSGAERASHKRNADAAEAALLAKLGRGWIPQGIPIGQCCCRAHHPNYGRCLQCPIHGMLPPGASDD